ncbi:MAG: hypothetical protein O2887_18950 [Bacteroidetes bacterium]|nr:hypothetical protein [Bacteroidota bacterium]MDA1122532.1 hypothetical protein [Bacteroidota bacterium]
MGIEIREVKSKKDLNRFVKFPFQLYSKCPYWIPPLIKDELRTFSAKHNPAFGHCTAKLWIAYSNDEIVGRIAGIVHQKEAQKDGIGRFGWLDFMDDLAISKKLLDTVEEWIQEQGMTKMHGPLGFTDMDFEGMLIEGFKEMGTIATIYNYEYYPVHMDTLGFNKVVDWVEMEGVLPTSLPPKMVRKAEIIEARFGLRSLKFNKIKELLSFGKGIFKVLNESYANLHGFYPLTDEQISHYISQYLSYLKPEFSSVVVNSENEVVGFGIAMPSFSRAFQKAKGHLFPFGYLHLLKALRNNDLADLYLMGVSNNYQKFGVSALILKDILQAFNHAGIKKVVTNPMLENNHHILTQWNEFQGDSRIHRRRRCFVKKFV